MFSFIDKNKIKFAIATHGGNHVILQHQSSPIHSYMNNLDPTFTPFGKINNIEYEMFTFSGGEPHIKIISDLNSTNHVN